MIIILIYALFCLVVVCPILYAWISKPYNWNDESRHKKDVETCEGCKHLWMRNDGGYECLINAEKACIGKKPNYQRRCKVKL